MKTLGIAALVLSASLLTACGGGAAAKGPLGGPVPTVNNTNPTPFCVGAGQTKQINLSGVTSDPTTVLSSDTTIATVSGGQGNTYNLTGVAVGSTNIRVIDNYSNAVIVTDPVTVQSTSC